MYKSKRNIDIDSEISKARSAKQLFKIFADEKSVFDATNLSTLFNQLRKKLEKKDFYSNEGREELLKGISEITKYSSDSNFKFDAKGIFIVLNALSRWPISRESEPYKFTILYLIKQIPGENFIPIGIEGTLSALSRLSISIKDAPYDAAILHLVKRILDIPSQYFKSKDISGILGALSRLPTSIPISIKGEPYESAILHLAKRILDIPSQYFNLKDIVGILGALSRLPTSIPISIKGEPYESAILHLVKRILDIPSRCFIAKDISGILIALSRLPIKDWPYDPAILHLVRQISEIPSQNFGEQSIANILNAFSKWFVSIEDEFYRTAILHLVALIPQNKVFHAQEIANALSALRKWPLPKNKNYERAISSLVGQILKHPFNEQEITNILSALRMLSISLQTVSYDSAILHLVKQIPRKNFNAQGISNTLIVLAKLSATIQKEPYASAINSLMKQIKSNSFDPEGIVNILRALSKWLILLKEEIYEPIILYLAKQIQPQCFNGRNTAKILNALSEFPIPTKKDPYHSAILGLVERIRTESFNEEELATALNALSKLPTFTLIEGTYHPKEAILHLVQQVPKRNFDSNLFNVVSIIFTLSLLKFSGAFYDPQYDKITSNLIEKYANKLIEKLDRTTDHIAAMQLYQIYLYRPELFDHFNALVEKIKSFIPRFKDVEPTYSTMQKNVSRSLENYLKIVGINFEFQEEYFIGFTHVDIAFPECNLVIQSNGPFHYFDETLNIRSQFNTHLLEKQGWSVKDIPYFDWKKCSNNERKNEYFSKEIKPCLEQAVKNKLVPLNTCRNNEQFFQLATSTQSKTKSTQCSFK